MCTMRIFTLFVIFPVTLAIASNEAAGKAPKRKSRLKVSDLQQEIEHVSAELTQDAPNLRNNKEKAREIQTEVEFMISRVEGLHNGGVTNEFAKELDGIEEALDEETSDRTLKTEITTMRTELCEQNGFQNHEFAACQDFMRKSCGPAADADAEFVRDLPLQEHCTMFFREEAAVEGQQGDGAQDQGEQGGGAPAPAPGGPGGPAPGPVPMGPFFGGKKLRALPDQGFDGHLGKHVDFDTMTEDWHREFGPKAGHRSPREICADFPDNQWCRIHGYYPTPAPPPDQTVIDESTVTEVERVDGGGGGGGTNTETNTVTNTETKTETKYKTKTTEKVVIEEVPAAPPKESGASRFSVGMAALIGAIVFHCA